VLKHVLAKRTLFSRSWSPVETQSSHIVSFVDVDLDWVVCPALRRGLKCQGFCSDIVYELSESPISAEDTFWTGPTVFFELRI
jgi:hypothetical protein